MRKKQIPYKLITNKFVRQLQMVNQMINQVGSIKVDLNLKALPCYGIVEYAALER